MSYILPNYARIEVTFEKGEGAYLYNNQGKRYLDFASGIAVNSLGHNHPKITEAIQIQAEKLIHTSNLYHVEGMEEAASKLCKASNLDYTFFCNSGAEAGETAIKMVRRYHWQNKTDKNEIITFNGAFHGRTIATISAAGKYLEGFEPALGGFINIPLNSEVLNHAISDKTAAIMLEPIQGEGGINVIPEEMLNEIAAIARKHNALLVIDEVQSGIGRTGKLFAYEYSDIQPDIIMSAKGLGSGYPVGAVICSKKVGDCMIPGTHGSTYGGNPLGMAIINAVLDEINTQDFLKNVTSLSTSLSFKLEKNLNPKHSLRGKGLMIGIKLDESLNNKDICAELREKGLLTVPAADNVIRLLPPLNITEEHINEAVEIISQVVI